MATSPASRLLRSAPYFPVADVEESATYYERALRRAEKEGAPPTFLPREPLQGAFGNLAARMKRSVRSDVVSIPRGFPFCSGAPRATF